MLIERNIFHLKFGKAKEAIAIWKEILSESKKLINAPEMRLLSDISGRAYTLIVEMHLSGFNDINPKNAVWVTHEKFQKLYDEFKPLCESAEREYLKIESIV